MSRPYNSVPQDAYTIFLVSEMGWSYQVSDHLQLWELACSDGSDEVRVCMESVEVFEKIRKEAGDRPLTVLSWYRTPEYNARDDVRGSEDSRHLYGMAGDIWSRWVPWYDLCNIANRLDVGGMGRYPTKHFCHFDTFGINRRWTH